ncbi:MAG: SEC-C domain-containing protein [Planctomycetes bacterium]|nr:SEC-C domain-containing protein [Planctomycetota bacterium]MCB9900503.1 SEC-C domain-containing protein [Planctomycetota bacterium]
MDDDPDELDGEDVGFWEPHDEPDDSIELPPLEPPSPLTLLTSRDERPGRNDPCWCGSGKKYKKCHQPVDEGENISNP